MALKIGAFLLASANFISASMIHQRVFSDGNGNLLGVHYDHRLEPEPMPQLGVVVKDYVIGDEDCKADCKKVVKVVKSHSPHHSHHGSHSQDSHHSHDSDHGHNVVHAHGSYHGSTIIHAHGHDHPGHQDPNSHSHEVVIKDPKVRFNQIGDVDRDDKNFAKAPVTIVNIPLVSSVGDTEHKVSANYNKDRSNLPEDKYEHNWSAKKELLSYDNLLKTAVRPVKKVSAELRKIEKSPKIHKSPIKYKVVVPGELEHYTSHQVAIGETRENANPVITNFKVTHSKDHHHHRDESCDSLSADKHRNHSKGWKTAHVVAVQKTVQVVQPNPNVISAVRVEKASRG